MKKILLTCATLLSLNAFAQDYPENEIKLNIFNAIAIASVEVGYERFVDSNQSIEVEMFINDRFSYFPKNSNKKFSAVSFKIGYNYYFDIYNLSGPYINPFIKQRFGNYKETKEGITDKTNLNSFMLGIGLGYLWNYNDTFVIAPYVNIARNFRKEVNSKFWAIEPNAGIKIGYRF